MPRRAYIMMKNQSKEIKFIYTFVELLMHTKETFIVIPFCISAENENCSNKLLDRFFKIELLLHWSWYILLVYNIGVQIQNKRCHFCSCKICSDPIFILGSL